MRFRLCFEASIPKLQCDASANEDVFRCNGTERFTRIAVSDGASESYDSRTFARCLCDAWIATARRTWPLKRALRAYNTFYQGRTMGWADIGAFERGSFATFLGVDIEEDTMHIYAVGDTLSAYHGSTQHASFPFVAAEEFNNRPTIFSTLRRANQFYLPIELRARRHTQRVRPGDKVLLLTDAIGAWFLGQEQRDEARGMLESFSAVEEFQLWVDQERSQKRMRDDDTTLIHLEVTDE